MSVRPSQETRHRPAWAVLWLVALLMFSFQLDCCISPYAVAPGMTAVRVAVPDDDDDDDSEDTHATHAPKKDGQGLLGRILKAGDFFADLVRSIRGMPRLRAMCRVKPHSGPPRRFPHDRGAPEAGSAGTTLLTLLGVSLT